MLSFVLNAVTILSRVLSHILGFYEIYVILRYNAVRNSFRYYKF